MQPSRRKTREQYPLSMRADGCFRFSFICQSQDKIEEERERVNASIVAMEEELESCRDQGEQWRKQLESTSQE